MYIFPWKVLIIRVGTSSQLTGINYLPVMRIKAEPKNIWAMLPFCCLASSRNPARFLPHAFIKRYPPQQQRSIREPFRVCGRERPFCIQRSIHRTRPWPFRPVDVSSNNNDAARRKSVRQTDNQRKHRKQQPCIALGGKCTAVVVFLVWIYGRRHAWWTCFNNHCNVARSQLRVCCYSTHETHNRIY